MPDMISCMTVNNEIGVIQPVKSIARMAHHNGLLFHTDAVQSVGHIPIDAKDIGCDMLSASGHKFGSPKGVGFLYVKNGIGLFPLINGGKQERSIRGGTENVLGIVAMAAALKDAVEYMEERNEHIKKLNTRLLIELLSIDGVYLNGSFEHRVNSNINVRIDGVKGEDVVSMCDQYGVCISAGSACNEGVATPSHVLKAIGLTDEEALSSIRITLGHQNTIEEIDKAAKVIKDVITILRKY
jgi:cysteine desulfurase